MLNFPSFCRGGVAQLVRAIGSYPLCPGFKSLHRHQIPSPSLARDLRLWCTGTRLAKPRSTALLIPSLRSGSRSVRLLRSVTSRRLRTPRSTGTGLPKGLRPATSRNLVALRTKERLLRSVTSRRLLAPLATRTGLLRKYSLGSPLTKPYLSSLGERDELRRDSDARRRRRIFSVKSFDSPTRPASNVRSS